MEYCYLVHEDFESDVSEAEINPLAVLEQGSGCLALDAVIVTKEGA